MEEKLLSSIDPIGFMQSSGWNFNKSWSGSIDISAWLRSSVARGGRLFLLLVYQDQESKHTIPIDRCMASSSSSVLMNGRVKVNGRGNLKSLQVKLKTEGCDSSVIFLEDLSVKALGATKTRRLREAV